MINFATYLDQKKHVGDSSIANNTNFHHTHQHNRRLQDGSNLQEVRAVQNLNKEVQTETSDGLPAPAPVSIATQTTEDLHSHTEVTSVRRPRKLTVETIITDFTLDSRKGGRIRDSKQNQIEIERSAGYTANQD